MPPSADSVTDSDLPGRAERIGFGWVSLTPTRQHGRLMDPGEYIGYASRGHRCSRCGWIRKVTGVVPFLMKFTLIDRIVEFSRGERLVAVKAVSLAEEYLADHFPTFPVLPGVLMLEAMTEAAAWLLREAADFAPGLILLREARNVTYKSFVKPGDLLRIEVHGRRLAQDDSEFDGAGYCESVEVVRARFRVRWVPVAPGGNRGQPGDDASVAEMRRRFAVLYPPVTVQR